MRGLFKILTFTFLITGFVIARGNNVDSAKSAISIKINQYYFDINDEDIYYNRSKTKLLEI